MSGLADSLDSGPPLSLLSFFTFTPPELLLIFRRRVILIYKNKEKEKRATMEDPSPASLRVRAILIYKKLRGLRFLFQRFRRIIIGDNMTSRNNPVALKGNQAWKKRSSHGRNPIFKTPAQLWKSCVEYFVWVEKTPLKEMKLFAFQGVVTEHEVDRMRAMTLGGLTLFLDIDMSSWYNYVKRDGFFKVTQAVEQVIRQQKFSGAAADLLNAHIIARDLGLADKREHTGPGGGPIQAITTEMTSKQAAEAYADTLKAEGG